VNKLNPGRYSRNGSLRGGKSVELLDPTQSAGLHNKLLAEIPTLASAEAAVIWANSALPAKNTLVAANAKLVEEAFEQKMAGLPSPAAASADQHATGVIATPREELQASRAGSDAINATATAGIRRGFPSARSGKTTAMRYAPCARDMARMS